MVKSISRNLCRESSRKAASRHQLTAYVYTAVRAYASSLWVGKCTEPTRPRECTQIASSIRRNCFRDPFCPAACLLLAPLQVWKGFSFPGACGLLVGWELFACVPLFTPWLPVGTQLATSYLSMNVFTPEESLACLDRGLEGPKNEKWPCTFCIYTNHYKL